MILGGDLNGHVGSGAEGYEGVNGGYSTGTRNVEGELILEMCDTCNLVLCNTVFKKEQNRLITYKSGDVKSAIYYLVVKRQHRDIVQNVNAIAGEECVFSTGCW